MHRSRQLALIGGISALGSLAVHMFVPAMPQAAHALSTNAATIQLAITLYLVGMAVGQLLSGSLSDAFGRRPILLAGVALFAVGSASVALAPTTAWLLLGRFVQALGGASALISGRAIVIDAGRGRSAASDMAGLTVIVLISPALAPTLSGLIIGVAGWRAPFMLLTLVALLLGGLAWRHLPESHAGPRAALRPRTLFVSWYKLVSNRRFMRYTLANALLTLSLYMFLASAPFFLSAALHFSAAMIGLSLLPVAVGAIIGARSVRLVESRGRDPLSLGKYLCLGGGLVLLICAAVAPPSLPVLIGPMFLFALGTGLTGPSALAGALQVDTLRVGSASSLFGALQMGVSAAGTIVIAMCGAVSPLLLAELMFAPILLAAILFPGEEGERSRDDDLVDFDNATGH